MVCCSLDLRVPRRCSRSYLTSLCLQTAWQMWSRMEVGLLTSDCFKGVYAVYISMAPFAIARLKAKWSCDTCIDQSTGSMMM